MSYRIYYAPRAEKYLFRLPQSKARAILRRIEYVALEPFKKDNNIVKLEGTIASFRLRVGDIRIIYQLDIKSKNMYVTKIAPRGSIYL